MYKVERVISDWHPNSPGHKKLQPIKVEQCPDQMCRLWPTVEWSRFIKANGNLWTRNQLWGWGWGSSMWQPSQKGQGRSCKPVCSNVTAGIPGRRQPAFLSHIPTDMSHVHSWQGRNIFFPLPPCGNFEWSSPASFHRLHTGMHIPSKIISVCKKFVLKTFLRISRGLEQ